VEKNQIFKSATILTIGLITGMIGQTTSLDRRAVEELKWMDKAGCIGLDTDHFFAGDETKVYDNKPLLQKICSNCDVLEQCQEYSLRYAVQGWWGNTSEKQRREKRQQLNITPIAIVSERVYE
jgi:hypothetical protein